MSRRGRRRPAGQLRCSNCKAPITFFASPFTGSRRPFNPKALDGHDLLAGQAFPVMSGRAYKLPDLIEVIQVQRECSSTEAEAEVRDMPWHTIHACEPTTAPPATGSEEPRT
jgi:hypothetical protein